MPSQPQEYYSALRWGIGNRIVVHGERGFKPVFYNASKALYVLIEQDEDGSIW